MTNFEDNIVFGCIPDKKDIRDYKIKKAKAMAINYPETFELDNRVTVKNQGNVGSCVAHAMSEILEYHYTTGTELSTNFIYGIRNYLYKSTGEGMYLRHACKISKDYGDPIESYCPGNIEINEVFDVAKNCYDNPEAMKNAQHQRIKQYVKLSSDDDVKYSLMKYGPVLAMIEWFSGSEVIHPSNILVPGEIFSGYHAIMIYGWNCDGWLIQNSWGKGWGNGGKCVIPWDYGLAEAYSIVPTNIDTSDDIIAPSRNKIIDFIYKIINFILNLF